MDVMSHEPLISTSSLISTYSETFVWKGIHKQKLNKSSS